MIESGSTKKYILYAIGEIALVVIGILIALQINNWNEWKKARAREVTLLIELKSNLQTNSERLKEGIELEYTYYNSAKIIVNHLDRGLPYNDSLNVHFQLSQLSHDIVLVSSAYEAIKSIGFDVISNDSLRSSLIDLFDANYIPMITYTKGLEDQFWPSVTIPLWIKHLRLLSMEDKILGQVPINYQNMVNNVEFRSMLEKRGAFRFTAAKQKQESLYQTELLIDRIERELNKR